MALNSIHIIDDNETDRYLLKRLIKSANLATNVFESSNGREAMEFLTEACNNRIPQPDGFPPMLIFLDINMPIMGGFEFLEEYSKLVQETNYLESTVLTMVTSSESEEDKQRALTHDPVKGYMVKLPRTGEELKAIVGQYFSDL